MLTGGQTDARQTILGDNNSAELKLKAELKRGYEGKLTSYLPWENVICGQQGPRRKAISQLPKTGVTLVLRTCEHGWSILPDKVLFQGQMGKVNVILYVIHIGAKGEHFHLQILLTYYLVKIDNFA